jgi:hypothetical protein
VEHFPTAADVVMGRPAPVAGRAAGKEST